MVYGRFGHGKACSNILPTQANLACRRVPIDPLYTNCGQVEEMVCHALRECLWLPMFGQWLKENYRTFISLLGRWRGSSREMRWRYGWLSLGPFGTPGTSFVLKLSSPNQVIYSVEPQPCYKTINDWISTLWDHKHLSVTPCLTGALYMFLFIYLV